MYKKGYRTQTGIGSILALHYEKCHLPDIMDWTFVFPRNAYDEHNLHSDIWRCGAFGGNQVQRRLLG